jgi:AcrR family transcriptional regulator
MAERTTEEDTAGRMPRPADDRAALRVGLGLIAGPDQDVPGEGLRERKKRLTRKLLSDTATRMFVARGFDEVTIADIAAACGVSEKTVWNYFPAKETLLLDVEDATVDAIRREIGNGAPPVEAMLRVLDRELKHTTDQLAADLPGATLVIQRFSELVDSVPALRNYHRGMMDRLVDATAEAIAGSLGRAAADPETQIAATSLVGLFRIQLRAIRQAADGTLSPDAVQQRVRSEVRRAATIIDHGLRTG